MDGGMLSAECAQKRLDRLRDSITEISQDLRNPDKSATLAGEVDLMAEIADRLDDALIL